MTAPAPRSSSTTIASGCTAPAVRNGFRILPVGARLTLLVLGVLLYSAFGHFQPGVCIAASLGHWEPGSHSSHSARSEFPRRPLPTRYLTGDSTLPAPRGLRPNAATITPVAFDGAWRTLTPPLPRLFSGVVYDSRSDRYVLFGGFAADAFEFRNDVWVLSAAADRQWQRAPVGQLRPLPRWGHITMIDEANHRLLVFGGYLEHSPWYSDELWALSLADFSWTRIEISGTQPGPRAYSAGVFDSERQELVFFGGDDGQTYKNDAWRLRLTPTPEWEEITPAGALPAARGGHTLVWDKGNRRAILYGGYDDVTRMGDLWELNLSATPTWIPLTPTEPTPGARSDHVAAFDPVGQRMIVFGGFTNTYMNDVWVLSWSAGQPHWISVGLQDSEPWGRVASSGAWDTRRNQFMLTCGYAGLKFDAKMREDTWFIDPTIGSEWRPLFSPNPPWARHYAPVILDPVTRGLMFYGGLDWAMASSVLWHFSLTGDPYWQRWTDQSGLIKLYGHSLTIDTARSRMALFAGHAGCFSTGCWKNDVWVRPLGLSTENWEQLTPTGLLPVARRWHSAIYDALRDRLVVFGGDSMNGEFLDDLWVLEFANGGTWRQIPPSSPQPTGRWSHGVTFDGVRNVMWMFGGETSMGTSNELWRLDLSPLDPVWQLVTTYGIKPTERPNPILVFDAMRNRLLLAGGSAISSVPRMMDLWEFPLAGPPYSWRELAPMGDGPTMRAGASGLFDQAGNRMLIFGGYDGGAYHNDVWALEFVDVSAVGEDASHVAPGIRMSAPWPNPTSGISTFGVDAVDPVECLIQVFDVTGRSLRVVHRGGVSPGARTFTWDGRSERGELVPPGMYFIRLSTGSATITHRLIRI
jgi:hypothetical protein